MGADLIGYIYAAAVASGGIMGYAKAGSMVSLGAGVGCGALLAVGAYQMSQDPRKFKLALVTTVALAGLMGMRYVRSGKFMPAGLVASLSIMNGARLGYHATKQ